jgi:hypothetical protein
LRTAVLAVRLGELAGASAQELADTYYVALLHASGCTSNGHEAAQLFGDDIAHRAAFFLIDATNAAEVLAFYQAHVGAGRPPDVRSAMIEEPRATREEQDDPGNNGSIRRPSTRCSPPPATACRSDLASCLPG